MTEKESSKATEPFAPAVQRTLWRRAWLGVAVFVLLTPVLLWIAIDRAGKREWREVQARLQANGEATTFEELNLPTREQVPDEDNFCALPWLIANADGMESKAMEELREKLRIFGGSIDAQLMRDARGNPQLGFPGDISAMARSFDLAAEEREIEVDEAGMQEAGSDPAARIAVWLKASDDFWQTAEAALARPHAYWLPMFAERFAASDKVFLTTSMPGLGLSSNILRAIPARAASARHSGDYETVMRSLEIAQRIGEASGNEPSLIGVMVAITAYSFSHNQIVECLWEETWQRDAARLQRTQALLERWAIGEAMAGGVRGELVGLINTTMWIQRNREAGTAVSLYRAGPADRFASLLPPGWFDSNAAFGADLIDRTLLEAYRHEDHADILSAVHRMRAEFAALNKVERLNSYLANMLLAPYQSIIIRAVYAEACHLQALTVCALYRYRLDHEGKFPASLDQLVPDYLDAVPADPIDGAAMRYAATADGSFTLYAIGIDASDDGGVLNLDPDRLEQTRIDRDSYLGDWPWPVVPREMTEAGAEEK